jgi:hypothetical protein
LDRSLAHPRSGKEEEEEEEKEALSTVTVHGSRALSESALTAPGLRALLRVPPHRDKAQLKIKFLYFTHLFNPNITCCRPNARMRGVAALNCHLLTPSTNVVASFLAPPLRLTHTAPPITATKFRKNRILVEERSSSLGILRGSYQISCGFRPCQLKSSFFGDSLFPKIGIEINSLRDLQEAPSKSGGEG